ncbi:MAG: hypothetical protein ACJ768_20425 [Gaiellaceae bacterium]
MLAVLAALAVTGSAAGAPPVPTGSPLGPPITIPLPKPGKVSFYSVTVTGKLKPGAKPTLAPIGYGRPDPNVRLAGGMTKPKTRNGTTTATFYFAIKNIATARVLSGTAIAPPPQVDVFGNPGVWTQIGFGPREFVTCAEMKKIRRSLAFLWSIYSFGDTPEEMWAGGLSSCP